MLHFCISHGSLLASGIGQVVSLGIQVVIIAEASLDTNAYRRKEITGRNRRPRGRARYYAFFVSLQFVLDLYSVCIVSCLSPPSWTFPWRNTNHSNRGVLNRLRALCEDGLLDTKHTDNIMPLSA